MKKKIIINYICEVNYPNTSAYSIHVMKMCDAFARQNEVNLFVPSSNISYKNLKAQYNIKNRIKLINVFKKKIKLHFIFRLLFAIKILFKINAKNNKNIYLSRSIIFAFIASIFKKKIILELHHEFTGLTKIIFRFLSFFGCLKNLKYIFIHKNLKKYITLNKKNFITLDDAIDLNDFKQNKIAKKIKNTCVYVGSFHPGKGIEIIKELSKKLKMINFHLYGDKKFLKKDKYEKNIQFFNFIKYKKIPHTLKKYEIALMPYGNRVLGRSSNIDLSNYMSPLKMFDYLASGNIILASKLKVYSHILRHKKNAILINNNNIEEWIFWINVIFKSVKKYNFLKKNALKTSQRFTWQIRAEKIINFSKKVFTLND
ncbi:glycosyltransferase [Candidatus Pelagibacter sp.]|nr:glycosyltransferase [Candidatus Pelagibacter sp.]